MKTFLIQSAVELQANRRNWQYLAGQQPFFSFDWMGSWLDHLALDSELAVVVVADDNNQWLGLAPLCVCNTIGGGKQLRFLSSGKACADYLGLICDETHNRLVADSVAEWLAENLCTGGALPKVDSVELDGICLRDSHSAYFVERMEVAGFDKYDREIEGCWALDLPESWDELNKQFRSSHRRKTKKAVKLLNADNCEVVSSRYQGIAELWDSFVYLHQGRREFLGQPGCFADENFEKFLFQAVHQLAEKNRAEILQVNVDGRPLGAYLMLNDSETQFMYQSGIDVTRTKMEPGYVVTVAAIQSAIRNGFVRFDFLRGDEPYKARWNANRIALSKTKLIAPRFSARFKHQIWLSGKSLKDYATSFGFAGNNN